MWEVGMLQTCPTASVFLDSVSTQLNRNWKKSSQNLGPWKKYKLFLTERPDVPEDFRLFISNQQKMQRLLKKPCAIKKLMVVESELIFQSPKGPTLPLLVYTWADLLTGTMVVVTAAAEEAVVVTAEVAVVTAAAVTETMTTAATAEVAAAVVVVAAAEVTAAGMAAVAEAVDPPLLITEADHEGTTAHVPDLTHHVAIDSL